MKKLLLMMLILVSNAAFSQEENPHPYLRSANEFSKWSIGAFGTYNYPATDVKDYDKFSGNNYSYGASLKYSMTHAFGLEMRYGMGNLEGSDSRVNYRPKVSSEFSGHFNVSLGGISYLKNYQNFRINLTGGAGRMNFGVNSVNSSTGELIQDTTYTKNFITGGLGLTYRLGNRTNLSSEISLTSVPGDRLDGYKVSYSNNDMIARLTVGISYTLGKKPSMDWFNPIADMTPIYRTDSVTVRIKGDFGGNSAMMDSIMKADSILKANSVSKASLDNFYIGSVYFNTGQFEVDPTFQEMLSKIRKFMKENPYLNIKVVGYTDAVGSPESNIILSRDRAQSVSDYLQGTTGVVPSRIFIDYKGIAPETFNDVTNRRADIYIVK